MNRQAIIISAPGILNQKGYLEGALKDSQLWREYLMSLAGGEWYSNEIKIFTNESKSIIKSYIDNCSGDYAFVAFSGHGFVNSQNGLTYCKTRENEYMTEHELKPAKISKVTISLDTCREVTSPSALLETLVKSQERTLMGISNKRIHTRAYFDTHVAKNLDGTIVLYGASENEEADENRNGGYYTQSIIKCGLNFAINKNSPDILDVYDALLCSKINIKAFTATQTPKIAAGRRNSYFPFAIKEVNSTIHG